MNTTAPKAGDLIAHKISDLPGLPGARIVAKVLEVDTIPPHQTVDPNTPRWAMNVLIIEGDRHFRPGTTSYWPGMGPGDFERVAA